MARRPSCSYKRLAIKMYIDPLFALLIDGNVGPRRSTVATARSHWFYTSFEQSTSMTYSLNE